MDTKKERAIVVKMDSDKLYKFVECPDGLYYFDASAMPNSLSKSKSNVTPYSFAMTVSDNKSISLKVKLLGLKERIAFNKF